MLKKALFFSHDPGGANVIAPVYKKLYTKYIDQYTLLLYGKNYSLKVYEEQALACSDIASYGSIESVKHAVAFLETTKPDLVVTGTSANDFTERYLWEACTELKIPSVAILDQWLGYRVRFSESQQGVTTEPKISFLPDIICVPDASAQEEMVEEGFPAERIVVTGSPYFETIQERYSKIDDSAIYKIKRSLGIEDSSKVVLFASEPIVESYKDTSVLGYTQFTILDTLTSVLQMATRELHLLDQVFLLVRLHPRNDPHLFEEYFKKYKKLKDIKIIIEQSYSPQEIIALSDLVIGISSMLLIESFLADKPILSLQIGRKNDEPFILSRKGLVETVLTQGDLEIAIKNYLSGNQSKKEDYAIIDNASDNIVGVIQSIRS